MLVLEGNIPRFPWEPSTTMLTYRLNGTTEATASNRNRRHHSDRSAAAPPPPGHHHRDRDEPQNLRSPRRAPKVLYVADLRLCPSGGRCLMHLRNCAIHPNHPVGDAPGTSPD